MRKMYFIAILLFWGLIAFGLASHAIVEQLYDYFTPNIIRAVLTGIGIMSVISIILVCVVDIVKRKKTAKSSTDISVEE